MTIRPATEADVAELTALHNAVADDLTVRFGKGRWSFHRTERGSLHDMKTGRVVVQADATGIVGTLMLATRKPWAIDVSHFTPVARALYLQNMAVRVDLQRQGIGRSLLTDGVKLARQWPADALRLDAYDTAAGAGPFYAKCGFSERGTASYRGTPLIYYELLL